MSTDCESWKFAFLIESDVDRRSDIVGDERRDAVRHFPNKCERAKEKGNQFGRFQTIFVAAHFESEPIPSSNEMKDWIYFVGFVKETNLFVVLLVVYVQAEIFEKTRCSQVGDKNTTLQGKFSKKLLIKMQ